MCLFTESVSSSGWSIPRQKSASCDYPVHAYLSSVHQVQCVVACLEMAGCVTYKFRAEDTDDPRSRRGHCALLKPQTTQVPEPNTDGWQCYFVADM